jgi:hypothetical protein
MVQLAMGITPLELHGRDMLSRFFYSEKIFGKILGEIWEESNLVAQALKEWRKSYEPGEPAHPDSNWVGAAYIYQPVPILRAIRPMCSAHLSSSMQEDATMSPPSQLRHGILTARHS